MNKLELKACKCGICNASEHKIILTENKINVCTDCAKWIQKRAAEEGNLPHIQLYIDTKYLNEYEN